LRKRVSAGDIRPDMNVTPLVDVVLVLLIIFMVVTPRRQDVRRSAGHLQPDPEVEVDHEPLKVTVAKAGEYHIDGVQYDLDGAITHLGDAHASEPLRRLVLRADAASPTATCASSSRARSRSASRHRAHGGRAAPTTDPNDARLLHATGPTGNDRRRTGRGGVTPQMNVTPLVDVVLVLLIIFMVITPLLTKKFWVHTPKQEKEEVEPEQLKDDPNPPLVLKVGPERSIQVNGVDIGFEELPERLKRMFAARDHILFFDAETPPVRLHRGGHGPRARGRRRHDRDPATALRPGPRPAQPRHPDARRAGSTASLCARRSPALLPRA
jgi:biopolymer transport protein ExbD/biopolymer transport protein TolR